MVGWTFCLGTSLKSQIIKISGLTDAALFNLTLCDAMHALNSSKGLIEKNQWKYQSANPASGPWRNPETPKLSIKINHYETDGLPCTIPWTVTWSEMKYYSCRKSDTGVMIDFSIASLRWHHANSHIHTSVLEELSCLHYHLSPSR